LELAFLIIALSAGLYLIQEVLRRANRWVMWSIFLGLPLILTRYWISSNVDVGLFPWVKLYSVIVFILWLTTLRFTSLGRHRWALAILFLMLPLNIMEAVVKDLYGAHFAHALVAITGILLVVSLPHPARAIQIDQSSPSRDLVYEGMSRTWIIAYSVWNWTFVYLNFPSIAAHQVAVLMAAFVVGMVDPRRWLQARAFTLVPDLLMLATFPRFFISLTESSYWATPHRENVVAGICLIAVSFYAVTCFARGKTDSRQVTFPEQGVRHDASDNAISDE
jgi:hypothetical protein